VHFSSLVLVALNIRQQSVSSIPVLTLIHQVPDRSQLVLGVGGTREKAGHDQRNDEPSDPAGVFWATAT
jgi:hypothetical protein